MARPKASELERRCHARSKQTGRQCGQPAGAGTDHLGVGTCRWHGGATPIKHGRFSKLQRSRIRDLIAHHLNDPQPLDTLPELAATRALAVDCLNRNYPETASKLLAEATRIVERIERKNAMNAISQAELFRLMAQMGRVVETYVADPDVLVKIREGWLKLGTSIRVNEAAVEGN